ncbi:MAG TPA: hypothetical protein VND87_14600 [Stellaceae bacterium]|nr:hypothetical protein [Stellaceae bacterium]
MWHRNAALACVLACAACAAPKPALPPAAQQAADRVPAALDAAEAALRQCHEPQIELRAQTAIAAARTYLSLAETGDPGMIVALNSKMDLIRSALETCLQFKKIADTYHANCRGDVSLGMTEAEVRRTAWCAPTKIVTTETQRSQRAEWIYTADAQTQWIGRPVGFLYFTDGRLTSIERSTP